VRAALGLVVLALVAAGGAGGRSARVIDVPADEPTIAAAIAAALPGDTVLIEPGTYSPSVKVPAGKHDLTIRAPTATPSCSTAGGRCATRSTSGPIG
jgi:hypothetical protein